MIVVFVSKKAFYHSLISPAVTRFDEISQLWQNFKSLCNFLLFYIIFGELLYQLWHFYAIRQIVIVVNVQRLNNNIAIWTQ